MASLNRGRQVIGSKFCCSCMEALAFTMLWVFGWNYPSLKMFPTKLPTTASLWKKYRHTWIWQCFDIKSILPPKMPLQYLSQKWNLYPQIWNNKYFSSSLYLPLHAKKKKKQPQTKTKQRNKTKTERLVQVINQRCRLTSLEKKKNHMTFEQISRQWWFHQWKILNIFTSVRCTSRENIYCIGKSGIVIHAPSRPQHSLPTMLVPFQGRRGHAGILEGSICLCSAPVAADYPEWVTGDQALIANFPISVLWFVKDWRKMRI